MRRGVGKIRHLHTPLLWIQKRAQKKELRVWKIDGKKNAADIGTKPLNEESMTRIMHDLKFEYQSGVDTKALRAAIPKPMNLAEHFYIGD